MHARDVEQAASDLARRKRRAVEAAVLGALSAALALAVAFLSLPLTVAFGTGALVELIVAAGAVFLRRSQIARLALDPAAYAIAEVEAYGRKLTRPPERARLAAWLEEIRAEANLPGSLYLADRVWRVAHELEALARELVSPAVAFEPVAAVACRRLLTHAVESPLYNPRVPADELELALRRIRAGMLVR
jgi:hypothetical protein